MRGECNVGQCISLNISILERKELFRATTETLSPQRTQGFRYLTVDQAW